MVLRPSLGRHRGRRALAVRRQSGRRLLAGRASRRHRFGSRGARPAGGGGGWVAERLEGTDSERVARDTLEEMKRGSATVGPKYARIEDLPDLPKYTEVEPGQARAE